MLRYFCCLIIAIRTTGYPYSPKRRILTDDTHRGFESYCETEIFNATCRHGEAIIVTHAQYGRMKINRCVKQDYGHVGCAADVIELIDVRCSGRRSCELAIPDALFAKTKPCPEDLKPYLEVGYDCVPVQTSIVACHASLDGGGIPVSSLPVGYISSRITELTKCGRPSSPWIIEAGEGQTIHVHLYDFNVIQLAKRISYVDFQCPAYAVLREILPTGPRNTTICGGTSRERVVYTSASNRLEIGIVTADEHDGPKFMFRYEVTGCTDVPYVSNAWMTRNDDHLIIRCNSSRHEYYQKCHGNQWIGEIANCSVAIVSYTAESIVYIDLTMSYGSYVIIALVTSLIVGFLVLIGGMLIIKSRKRVSCLTVPQESTGSSEKNYVDADWSCHVIHSPIRFRVHDTFLPDMMGEYPAETESPSVTSFIQNETCEDDVVSGFYIAGKKTKSPKRQNPFHITDYRQTWFSLRHGRKNPPASPSLTGLERPERGEAPHLGRRDIFHSTVALQTQSADNMEKMEILTDATSGVKPPLVAHSSKYKPLIMHRAFCDESREEEECL